MHVVVEGTDGSGKSSLIQELRRQCPASLLVLSRSRPPETLSEVLSFLRWVDGYVSNPPLVLDRYPLISEPIYGPLFRGTNLLAGIKADVFLTRMNKIIYCRPPVDRILANVQRTRLDQMAGVVDHTAELIEQYDRQFADLIVRGYPVVFFDYTRHTVKDLFPHWFEGESNG